MTVPKRGDVRQAGTIGAFDITGGEVDTLP